MNNTTDNIMTVKEVADYLRVNQRTVYRLAVDGRIPGFKVGANWGSSQKTENKAR